MARTYHVDAMRSWLVIGEVQALLNPMSVLVNAEYPPARPVLWTVVAIAPGGGVRGGGAPPPRTRRYVEIPTPPGLRPPPPPLGGGGSARRYPGKSMPTAWWNLSAGNYYTDSGLSDSVDPLFGSRCSSPPRRGRCRVRSSLVSCQRRIVAIVHRVILF